VRWSIVVMSATIVAVVAAIAVSITWNERAEDVCREEAPQSAGGYSVTWEWTDFAYVCDYRAPDAQPKRVGIIEAFHGDRGRRHR
jgi:hypothetical protein